MESRLLFWLFSTYWPVLADLFLLSCSAYPDPPFLVPAVLSPSGCSVPAVPPRRSVLAVLSWLSCTDYPFLVMLSIIAVLSGMPSSGGLVQALLSGMPSSGGLVLALLSGMPSSGGLVLALLSGMPSSGGLVPALLP
jgi:hypothetical protein